MGPILLATLVSTLDGWTYPVVEWLELGNAVTLPNSRPYGRSSVAAQLVRVSGLSRADSLLAESLSEFLGRKSSAKPFLWAAADSGYQPGLGLFFNPELEIPLGRLEIYEAIRVFYLGGLDTLKFDGRPWRGFFFELQGGWLGFRTDGFWLGFGKGEVWYGPGRSSGLFLSPNPFGLERVELGIGGGSTTFRSFFSSLEQGRYLSCHRLELVKPPIKLGLSEAVLYCGQVPFGYLNPFLPYYAVQHHLYRDDNIMWGIDWTLLWRGVKLYSELLVDDFMFEPTPAPHKLGLILGGYLREPLGFDRFGVFSEYVRIQKWVYTHRRSQNRWVKGGRVLGHPLGPDADLWLIGVERWFGPSRIGVNLRQERHGEGRIDLSYEEEGGDPNPKFPSGVVESRVCPQLSFTGWLGCRFRLWAVVGWEFIRNEGNRYGAERSGPVLILELQVVM